MEREKNKLKVLKGDGWKVKIHAINIPSCEISIDIYIKRKLYTDDAKRKIKRFKSICKEWWYDSITLSPEHFICDNSELVGYIDNTLSNVSFRVFINCLSRKQVESERRDFDSKFIEEIEWLVMLLKEEVNA